MRGRRWRGIGTVSQAARTARLRETRRCGCSHRTAPGPRGWSGAGRCHLDATAGLKRIALVGLEVGLQVDRDAPGGQEVDVGRPQPRRGLDRLRNALDLDLVADRALVGVEGELGLAAAVGITRLFPGERINGS